MADPSKEEEQELSVQLKARACFVLGRSQASRESERESHSREFDSFGLSKLLLGKKKTHTESKFSKSSSSGKHCKRPRRRSCASGPREPAARIRIWCAASTSLFTPVTTSEQVLGTAGHAYSSKSIARE